MLELTGQYINNSWYPRLAARYGTAWGNVGSTYIKLPDLRAYFPKGKESGESVADYIADTTAVNGLSIASTTQSHNHNLLTQDPNANSSSAQYVLDIDWSDRYSYNSDSIQSFAGSHTHTLTGDSRTQPPVAVGRWAIRL